MPLTRWLTGLGVVAGLALGLPNPVLASDGVIEINQASALAGGVNGSLVADPPGFPVIITQRGSYRLTGNLTVDQHNIAIDVQAGNTSIDLGGFGILGPNSCSVGSGPCTALGAGKGIRSLIDESHISVRNGIIAGMGSDGIHIEYGNGHRIEDVDVRDNGDRGVRLRSSNDSIARVHATNNRLVGISAGLGSRITNSTASYNGDSGIEISGNGLVSECTVNFNINTGIRMVSGASAVVAGNMVIGSGTIGVLTGPKALVTNNHIEGSGGCGVFVSGGVAGQTGSFGGNSLLGNNTSGSCLGFLSQRQIEGRSMATSCNVVTCTTGSQLVGTFCPPNIVTCLP